MRHIDRRTHSIIADEEENYEPLNGSRRPGQEGVIFFFFCKVRKDMEKKKYGVGNTLFNEPESIHYYINIKYLLSPQNIFFSE